MRVAVGNISAAPIKQGEYRIRIGQDSTRIMASGQRVLSSMLSDGGVMDSIRIDRIKQAEQQNVPISDEAKLVTRMSSIDSSGSATTSTGGTRTSQSIPEDIEIASTDVGLTYAERKELADPTSDPILNKTYSNTSSGSTTTSVRTSTTTTTPKTTYAERKISYLEDNF